MIGRLADVVAVGARGIRDDRIPIPASATSLRKIASAVGERQMFPVQTNRTPSCLPPIDDSDPIECCAERTLYREDMSLRHLLAIPIVGWIVLTPVAALSQDWPAKPIRVVIPFAAGSVSEAIFRTISPGVEADLGQRFIVESKPGRRRRHRDARKSCAPRPTATPCFSGRPRSSP